MRITAAERHGRRLAVLVLSVLTAMACTWGSEPIPDEIFTDVSDQLRLHFVTDVALEGDYYYPEIFGAGGGFLDYDNDGDLDIYLVNGAHRDSNSTDGAPLRNRLFEQESDGSFVDVTDESGLGDAGYGMGIAVGDIDNDADVDIYVTNVGPDALYRNDGDGSFTEISDRAGISNNSWGASVAFLDYDVDGFLDVFITNYVYPDDAVTCTDASGRVDYCGPPDFLGVPDVLYRNNGNGTFTDVSRQSGIGTRALHGLGVTTADFNGDAYPDIYVANDGDPNQLWINQRDGSFKDEALARGAAVNALGRAEAGMGVAAADADGDWDIDIFVTHIRGETNTFYRNSGNRFLDDTFAAGHAGPSLSFTGFGTAFIDFDHDSDLDLIVVNGRVLRGPMLKTAGRSDFFSDYAEPNLLFENDGTGVFSDISDRAPDLASEVSNSRGLAVGDVDNDGDMDLLVTNGGGKARLLRNNRGGEGNWLMIRAVDPALQRSAVGASITLVTEGARLLRDVGSCYSFLTSHDPRVHFGLGSADRVDEIHVRWPGGTTEVFPGVAPNQLVILRRGEGT